MGSSVQDFVLVVGIDKITRLTSSCVHAFSSVSDAMAGRRGAGGCGGQFSMSLWIGSTLWLKKWINWSALCVEDAEELSSSLSLRSILDNDCQSFAGVPLSAEIRSVQYLFFFATKLSCLCRCGAMKLERSMSLLVRRWRLSNLRQSRRISRHSESNHGASGWTRLWNVCAGANRSAMSRRA